MEKHKKQKQEQIKKELQLNLLKKIFNEDYELLKKLAQ